MKQFAPSFLMAGLAAGLFVAASAPVHADVKVDQAVAKAEEQFAKGKPDEAIKALTKLATGTPSVEAYLALARFQDRNGQAADAEASVAKAVELAASASPALKELAYAASSRSALRSGSGKVALEMAEKAVAAERNADALGALASAQARLGDAKSASASADAAVAVGAMSSPAYTGKGDALMAMGAVQEAATAFQKAATLDSKNVAAQVGLAYALVASGKPAEARAVAQKATEFDKNSGEAFAALGFAISAEHKFDGGHASWGDAIAQAQQGAFLAPKNPQVQMVVAKLFEARGNYDQAQAAYAKALESDPGFAPAKMAMITTRYRKGDLEGAIREATELLKANPANAEAGKMLGEFLARKGQYSEAIPHLEKATAALPKAADSWAILAHSYHMTRRLEDGKNAYAKAVALNPTSNDLKSNYGLLLGMSGDHEQGAQILATLTSQPGYKSAAGWANYGWVLSRMKPPKAAEAISAYQKAIALEPTNAGLHYGMGWAQYFAKAYPEAIAAFDKAGAMDKNLFAETRGSVGWSHYFIAVGSDRNFAKAKELVAAAEAAGRPDPRLADAITKYEEFVLAGKAAEAEAAARAAAADAAQDAIDVGKLSRQLQSGSPSQKVAAAQALSAAGADAAEILGWAVENDGLVAVRQAAVNALKRMGAGARRAVPALRRYAATPPPVNLNPTADEMRLEGMEADMRRDIRDILSRVR
jgi:tetratricopeptide (TPR) repeat protein